MVYFIDKQNNIHAFDDGVDTQEYDAQRQLTPITEDVCLEMITAMFGAY